MDLNHIYFTKDRYRYGAANMFGYDFGNSSVKQIVDLLNSEEPDLMVGHMYGINGVNQEKNYISINSMSDIKYKSRNDVSFVYTQMMAYYLLQDDQFVGWMKSKDSRLFEPR